MWKLPPIIKIYEALGAVADGRIQINGNAAQCFSSSGNKYYDVTFDPKKNAIMTNDNGSYWKDYVGYPAIAFLLSKNILPYREEFGTLLKGIAWKDVNQQFKNDFGKTLEFIIKDLDETKREELNAYVEALLSDLKEMQLEHLGKKPLPPSGY